MVETDFLLNNGSFQAWFLNICSKILFMLIYFSIPSCLKHWTLPWIWRCYLELQNNEGIPCRQHTIIIRITLTKKIHYFLLIYFNSKPLHISSRHTVHHQEVLPCIYSSWYEYMSCVYVDYTNCWLYIADLPDNEQQACSKHVEAYYWNKLIQNSASCWFMLYGYITKHGQKH